MREKQIENKLATEAKKLGGIALKFVSPSFDGMSGNRGISITPQLATLRSEQKEITTRYKENEHLRLSFVVEKKAVNRLICCYINGIMSGVVQYPADDDFAQSVPVDITIGSRDAAIDLYCIRVYDNDLTRHQVLNNWIADTQVVETMLERYSRNHVFDAYSQIVIAQLPKDLPYSLFLQALQFLLGFDNLPLEGIILVLPKVAAFQLCFGLFLGQLQRIQFFLGGADGVLQQLLFLGQQFRIGGVQLQQLGNVLQAGLGRFDG